MGRIAKRWLLGGMLLMALLLAGCADDGDLVIVHEGLVGIVDHPVETQTAPLLTIDYALPGVARTQTLSIFSDQPSGGDIAFDPVRGAYTLTQGASGLLFGVDRLDAHRPEFRAFLDFPLDGATGGPILPLEAVIVSASLNITVEFVDFAPRVPVLLDLVRYPVSSGLSAADFAAAPLARVVFDILDVDAGRELRVDVTALVREAQRRGLADVQLRFALAR